MDKIPLVAADVDRWANCAGSVIMQAQHGAPGKYSETKQEHDACKYIAARVLQSYRDTNEKILTSGRIIGTAADNNVIITQELYDLADEYVMSVLKHCNTNGLMSQLRIDSTVSLDHIYKGLTCKPDCYLFDEDTGHLVVWDVDFQYGVIEVYENWRLMLYASGVVRHLYSVGFQGDVTAVTLKMVQPRGYHRDGSVRDWTITVSDFQPYIDSLRAQANWAMTDDPGDTCNVGQECKKCTARHVCETLQRNVGNDIDYIGMPVPVALSGANLAYELQILKRAEVLLEGRLTGIEEQVKAELKKPGGSVPGFTLEQGYGNKAWKKDTPIDEVIMMGDLMEIDLRKPNNLITPTQAIKKGIDASVINSYSHTPKRGFKLVEVSETRAKQAFSN